jgi:hypothetical protein
MMLTPMGAVIAIFLTLGPSLAAQVDLPPTEEQERAAYIAQLEAELSQLPKITPTSVVQIVTFGLDHNMLSLRTQLVQPPDSPVHLVAPALRGYARLTLLGPQDDPALQGRNFSYQQHDLTRPDAMEITTISAIAGQLIVARDGERKDLHWSIQYVQDPAPAPGSLPETDPVRFLVHRTDESNEKNNLDLKLSAADFAQLRKRHAAELDAFLRPILRDFKQEGALFGVPSHVAWQVLGAEFSADPKLQERIRQIVARLDADNFREREKAAEDLKLLGQPAALALGKLDRSSLTLSQTSAIDAFLAEFAPLPSDQLSGLSRDKAFLLDVLFNDDAALRELAIKQLGKIAGRSIELKPDLDATARADEIARLRAELVPTTQPALHETKP